MENMEKEGKNIFFHIFFILLKTNTNYAHMQNFIQIPQKIKTGVQNVFKWEISPFMWDRTFALKNICKI